MTNAHLKEKHPAERRFYVVVIRRGPDDYEPTHPGSTDRQSANRLMTVLGTKGLTTELWTQEKWSRYDDRIRAEVFCEECGEERELCTCKTEPDPHTHHPDDVAGGNLPTDTERAQGGDDDPIVLASTTEPDYEGEERQYREYLADPAPHPVDYPPAPITVREYLEGEEERPVFLHTHLGALQVTGINFFSDGPWLRTGHGWVTASWCVAYSDRLYFDKAEAERSAS